MRVTHENLSPDPKKPDEFRTAHGKFSAQRSRGHGDNASPSNVRNSEIKGITVSPHALKGHDRANGFENSIESEVFTPENNKKVPPFSRDSPNTKDKAHRMMVRKPIEGREEKRHLRDSVLSKFIRKDKDTGGK